MRAGHPGDEDARPQAEIARPALHLRRRLKEEPRALYRCGPRSAPEHLRSWLSWASRSNLGPFVKLGRTLRMYRDGVLAAIRLRLSNGRMEGLNNMIVIKHRAYEDAG